MNGPHAKLVPFGTIFRSSAKRYFTVMNERPKDRPTKRMNEHMLWLKWRNSSIADLFLYLGFVFLLLPPPYLSSGSRVHFPFYECEYS